MMEKRVAGGRPTGIVIPRPKSAYSASVGRASDSYRSWMQEYHRQHQHHRNKQLRAASYYSSESPDVTMSSSRDPSVPSSPRRSKGTNLFLNFTSLKINPEDNEIIHKKVISHPQTNESSDTLDGYRIYKGPANLTLGLSRQHPTLLKSLSNGDDRQISHSDNAAASSHNHIILPDKFVLPTKKFNDQEALGFKPIPSHQAHHHPHVTPKHVTLPFQFHIQQQRRQRPHSASTAEVTAQPVALPSKDKKGSKTKESVKKMKAIPNTMYKTPTITTIQLQSSEGLTLTPRQNGTVHSSYKLSQCDDSKPSACFPPPKSILKNNKTGVLSIPPSSLAACDVDNQTAFPMSRHRLRHETPYHELLLFSNKIPHAHADTLSQTSQSSCLSRPAYNTIAGPREHRRPKSALASSCNYELLDRTASPRRKSVTFNSYVSFLSENRVSTIRSLPVDV